MIKGGPYWNMFNKTGTFPCNGFEDCCKKHKEIVQALNEKMGECNRWIDKMEGTGCAVSV